MKILYDHQIFSEQKYGGISRYFYEIIRRVSKNNKVNLYQGYNINGYKLSEKIMFDRCFSKKRPIFKGSRSIFEVINSTRFKFFAKETKVDIYHPTYYRDYNIKKGKLIVTVYDMIHEFFKGEFPGDKTAHRKKILVKKADGIIAISRHTKKDLVDIYNIDPNKIKVIYLANSLSEVISPMRLIKEPYILYVGSRDKYKNFINLLKAYSISLYKNDLLLVCFGGSQFNSLEKKLIKEYRLETRVIHKKGDDTVLSNLYNFAEVFVYPSKYEGFGIPPLEAMHYRTPVLVSNKSSIPEVVGNAGVYFDPYSVEDIADKIDWVLGDKNLRADLIKKGSIQEKLFSWDKCANETEKFYKKILECDCL